MTSGAHRVDTAKVAAKLSVETLTRAKPEFVLAHAGQAIGGVGTGRPSEADPDPGRRRTRSVRRDLGGRWHPRSVFPTTYAELVRITAGTPSEVA